MISIKNFLTNKEENIIKNEITFNGLFPLYVNTNWVDDQITPWLCHMIVPRIDDFEPQAEAHSEAYPFFYEIVKRFCDENNIELNKILRMAVNAHFANTTKELFGPKHVDHRFPHKNLILYLSEASGNTVLFDGDEIIHEEEPEFGKIFMFDGQIEHTLRPPKGDEVRYIMICTFN